MSPSQRERVAASQSRLELPHSLDLIQQSLQSIIVDLHETFQAKMSGGKRLASSRDHSPRDDALGFLRGRGTQVGDLRRLELRQSRFSPKRPVQTKAVSWRARNDIR
jgi:hypothetical protein